MPVLLRLVDEIDEKHRGSRRRLRNVGSDRGVQGQPSSWGRTGSHASLLTVTALRERRILRRRASYQQGSDQASGLAPQSGVWFEASGFKLCTRATSPAGPERCLARIRGSPQAMDRLQSFRPAAWEMTNQWVEQCLDGHPECKPWRDLRRDRMHSPAEDLRSGTTGQHQGPPAGHQQEGWII